MRKIAVYVLILALSLIIISSAWATNVSVPIDAAHFPDPSFRSWMTQFDYGWTEYNFGYEYTLSANDGILYPIEIARIQSLNPIGSSLKGIEYLSNLKNLVCRYMNLTELDISENSGLIFLDCEGNNIIKLDVSNNSKLKKLICNSNDLRELNINFNEKSALTELKCQFNDIKSLDISKNTALTVLYCNNNQLTELDLSSNNSITQLECHNQVRKGLKLKRTSEGYEVNMKDYVSKLENIEADSISPKPLSFNKENGIIIFNEPITKLHYNYITHSPNNDLMDVTITVLMSISIIEQSDYELSGLIICDMNDSNYLDNNGNPLDESAISGYNYEKYGKLGLAADGNSRLILRVQTQDPGCLTFSLKDDTGATLEQLTNRKNVSNSSIQVTTRKVSSGRYQASAVLIAPETFPESKIKNFPSDTFKTHVQFTPDDPEEDSDETDIELVIQAAPVVLIHGFGKDAKMEETFIDKKNANNGIYPYLLSKGFKVFGWNYDGTQGPSELLKGKDSELFKRIIKIFADYHNHKILCTKVDLVGYSMGGLVARRFCLPEENMNDGDYNTVRSYKQGMVRRIITIATPHKGSPWSNVYYNYPTFANTVLDGIYGDCANAWRDMRPGSAITSSNFPANIPMYAIYGRTGTNYLDFSRLIFDKLGNILYSRKLILDFAENYNNANFVNKFMLSLKLLSDFKNIPDSNIMSEIFGLEDHDFCVSESSARGDLSGYSKNYDGIIEYNHVNICKQNKIGEKVAELLKGKKEAFKTFSNSSSSNSIKINTANSEIRSATSAKHLNVSVSPEILNINDTGIINITAKSDTAINSNLYMMISSGDYDCIFAVASEDEKTFKAAVKFTTQDLGSMSVKCFAVSGNNIYVSNTADFVINYGESTPLQIITESLDKAFVGENYSFTLKASESNNITWKYTGNFPAGLELDE